MVCMSCIDIHERFLEESLQSRLTEAKSIRYIKLPFNNSFLQQSRHKDQHTPVGHLQLHTHHHLNH